MCSVTENSLSLCYVQLCIDVLCQKKINKSLLLIYLEFIWNNYKKLSLNISKIVVHVISHSILIPKFLFLIPSQLPPNWNLESLGGVHSYTFGKICWGKWVMRLGWISLLLHTEESECDERVSKCNGCENKYILCSPAVAA